MVYCSVLDCKTNSQHKPLNCIFHKFPKDPTLKQKWIEACGKINWVPNNRSIICSMHFTGDCYENFSKKKLHSGAVPNLFVYSRKNSTKNKKCIARNCTSATQTNTQKLFLKFPQNAYLAKTLYDHLVCVPGNRCYPRLEDQYFCMDHFDKKDGAMGTIFLKCGGMMEFIVESDKGYGMYSHIVLRDHTYVQPSSFTCDVYKNEVLMEMNEMCVVDSDTGHIIDTNVGQDEPMEMKEDIGLIEEVIETLDSTDEMCPTCLSINRKLYNVIQYKSMLQKLLPINIELGDLYVCFECRANMKSIWHFVQKVNRTAIDYDNYMKGIIDVPPPKSNLNMSKTVYYEVPEPTECSEDASSDEEISIKKEKPKYDSSTDTASESELMNQVHEQYTTEAEIKFEIVADENEQFVIPEIPDIQSLPIYIQRDTDTQMSTDCTEYVQTYMDTASEDSGDEQGYNNVKRVRRKSTAKQRERRKSNMLIQNGPTIEIIYSNTNIT